MQFSISAVFLGLATLAVALPADQSTSANGLRSQHEDGIRWHVPGSMTVKEAQSKCGDQAQLSCCNKATYAGDTTDVNSSLGSGLLSNLIGSGSGADGVGIFDQCSKLDAQVPIAIAVSLQDLINQRCKQNIACCANSPSDASNDLVGAALPCIALGSIL
ncbi:Hydrophobin [Penicillium subrubescens]|uniref:Hydrophobin n=1 Tax=Penicillium subrubescens TaxID=1316194 RepID=A0A1Q5U9U5_9EURO|nr:Hydrophobin [Penicillium subrubescens]KAJ5906965.1 Hydrophobin [Penicillium subrubescens]OKP09241.1 Rodlet protein [Penicillium subrubescens]